MFKQKSTLTYTVTFICAISLMLAACSAPPTRSPANPTESPVTEAPQVTEAPVEQLPDPIYQQSTHDCEPLKIEDNETGVTLHKEPIFVTPDPAQPKFAQDLVIIVGLPSDTDTIVRSANTADITLGLTPLSTITLLPKGNDTNIGLDPNGTIRNAFGASLGSPSVEIGLYRTRKAISETVQLINAIATANPHGKTVIAQPDYMTGRIGGNPWTIGGNPWTIGGNPIGNPTGSGQAFWTQWGLKNVVDKNWIINTDQPRNVNIAIFDTSPFKQPGEYHFDNWFTGLDKLGWAEDAPADVPLVICASDPLAAHFQHVISPSVDYSDHGAFVAGLTHAGAPGAHVDLVRSLFNDAEGDVFSLLANMTAYGLTHQDALSMTVINLSLGMQPPLSANGTTYDYEAIGMDAATQDRITAVLDQLFFTRSSTGRNDLLSNLPPDVAMAVVVTALTEPQSSNSPYKGATIVAAAGNDAFPDKVEEAQLPARYPNVIGVESAAFNGQRSCFSNTMQLKQPADRQAGGDCLGIEITTNTGAEKAIWDMVCRPDQDCPFTVTSISVNERQWMRWRGTSFAAPIVSGMEARKLP